MPDPDPEPARQVRARTAHVAIYPDPIRVARGTRLVLTGQEDIWDGHRWLWAEAGGRAGWIPDTLVDADFRARETYAATELDVAPGALLTLLHRRHGWGWCRAGDGAEGWVPLGLLDAT